MSNDRTNTKGAFLKEAPFSIAGFAIKAQIADPAATAFVFDAQKTMYGGKTVRAGDRIYIFASETHGGHGLCARGIVTPSAPTPRSAALRQTPRVSITVARDATACAPLGRTELRAFRGVADGSPQAELDFKLYRQATDKIVGLSAAATAFLDGLC